MPVIFISSAAENMNIITAINMGGDDFIAKPFDVDVLVAKINALLRRTYDFAQASHLLQGGGGCLSLDDGVFIINDGRVELTRNELRLLQVLLEQKGRIVSRDTLMQRLWETDSFVDDNTLTVNITRLRKKLTNAGAEDFILTKKGMGYLIK